MRVGFQISVFALAVFGLFCLVRLIFASIFSDSAIAVAVVVENRGKLDCLELLCCEAREALIFSGRTEWRILVKKELADSLEPDERNKLWAMAEEFNMKVCIFADHSKNQIDKF